MALWPTQADGPAFCPATTLYGTVALSFVIPPCPGLRWEQPTCLGQVQGGMNMGKLRFVAIQAQRAGAKNQPSPEGLGGL